jgi:hypothetical protein
MQVSRSARRSTPRGTTGRSASTPADPFSHPTRTFAEAARLLLGHSRADVTQGYAERDQQLAAIVAAKTG